jgi:hypothetical protein
MDLTDEQSDVSKPLIPPRNGLMVVAAPAG